MTTAASAAMATMSQRPDGRTMRWQARDRLTLVGEHQPADGVEHETDAVGEHEHAERKSNHVRVDAEPRGDPGRDAGDATALAGTGQRRPDLGLVSWSAWFG